MTAGPVAARSSAGCGSAGAQVAGEPAQPGDSVAVGGHGGGDRRVAVRFVTQAGRQMRQVVDVGGLETSGSQPLLVAVAASPALPGGR